MKRILFIILTIIALVAFLVLPASAAMLDYNHYIDNIWVHGENDVITLKFPGSGVWFLWGDSGRYSDVLEFDSSESSRTVVYDPFRHPDNSQDHLLRSDFPDNTSFELSFTASGLNHINSAYIQFYQLDKAGNIVESSSIPVTVDHIAINLAEVFYRCTFDSTLDFHESCYSFLMYYVFDAEATDPIGPIGYGHYKFYDADFEFTFTINSLLRQQMISNKTNNILGAVEDQLAENGQKLDDLINGSVSSSPPSGSGSVGDLDDIEGALRDESQVGLDQGLGMQQSALEVFVQYAAAFGVVKLIFELFSGIPFFTYLLYISVAVGIFSVLLNLSFDVRNSFNRKNRRSRSGS